MQHFFVILFFLSNISSAQTLGNLEAKACVKKLVKGVRFLKINSDGKNDEVVIRFAPYKLSQFHLKKFTRFKNEFEKTHGFDHTPFYYEQMVCRYYFGNYRYASLPLNVGELDSLLKECPLKSLDNLILAHGPIADCAPAAVDCKTVQKNSPKHPLDRIPCERIIKI